MRAFHSLLGVLLCAGCVGRNPLPAPRLPLTATPASSLPSAPVVDSQTLLQQLPDVMRFRLDNGLAVYVIEQHAFPHVELSYVSLRGGEDARELADAGLASLVTECLLGDDADSRSRTTTKPPPGEASVPAAQGSSRALYFSATTLRHTSVISTRLESSELSAAVAMLGDLVQRPVLDDTMLALAKQRVRASWDDERYNVSALARNYALERIYGPSHVLGQHADWAVKHVDEFALDSVKAAYQQRYVPAGSALVVVGDVRPEAALALVSATFGAWRATAPAPLTYEPSSWQPHGKRKVFVPNFRSRTSQIVVAQRAPSATSPAYPAIEMLAHVLGGSFSSRLMSTLRARDGLTYHVSASLLPRRDGSTLLIETSVPRDRAKPAFERVIAELVRLQREPVTAAELSRAKATLTHRALEQYETTSGAAQAVEHALELGEEPSTSLSTYLAQIERLTPAELGAVAREVLAPAKAPVIIVGDLAYSSQLGDWAESDTETF